MGFPYFSPPFKVTSAEVAFCCSNKAPLPPGKLSRATTARHTSKRCTDGCRVGRVCWDQRFGSTGYFTYCTYKCYTYLGRFFSPQKTPCAIFGKILKRRFTNERPDNLSNDRGLGDLLRLQCWGPFWGIFLCKFCHGCVIPLGDFQGKKKLPSNQKTRMQLTVF